MTGLTGRRVAVLLAVTPAAVGAQEAPTTNTALPSPLPAPTAAPTPQPEPAPVVTPPPVVVPTPAATPSTAATPVAPPATREPVAKPTPAATPAPDVRVPATSNPAEPLPPAAAPTPIPTPAPPTSAPVAPPTERVEEGSGAWPWLALLLLGFVVVAAYRRVRRRSPEPVAEPEPQPAPAPAATAPPPEPRVTIAFRPTRAGLNMLSATVEGELIVANTGSEPVREVRVATRLLSAHAGQDADLAAFAAASVNRPAVPPFALAAGERRAVRIVAATPREELRVMTAAGRPMFVPVLAVAVDAAGERAAQAFAIGVERVDSAKLAPFWLDVPARSYDQVAARAHRAMSGGPSDDR